jgi:hypothetical protein
MTPESKFSKRLVGLFLLGCILLNYPILPLFNLDLFIFGIPIFYLYIFTSWCVLILLGVLMTHLRSTKP